MTELENRAHAQKALISSDAIRFIMKYASATDKNEVLDTLIAKAQPSFMADNGWVVLNLPRVESLMGEEVAETEVVETQPVTAGSLAEAIMIGDVVAAYALIANRPTIALVDATADFDALYRYRHGEDVVVSELLTAESQSCSDERIKAVVTALTSALDGTYDSEAAAVKTAIMKAIKILH